MIGRGNRAVTESRSHGLVALALVALALFVYPGPVVAEALAGLWGVPLLPLYAFGAWLGVIVAAALLMLTAKRDPPP